jgi:hypothetical protein
VTVADVRSSVSYFSEMRTPMASSVGQYLLSWRQFLGLSCDGCVVADSCHMVKCSWARSACRGAVVAYMSSHATTTTTAASNMTTTWNWNLM